MIWKWVFGMGLLAILSFGYGYRQKKQRQKKAPFMRIRPQNFYEAKVMSSAHRDEHNEGGDEGRWGDQIIGKPRVIVKETATEHASKIHEASKQWTALQARYDKPALRPKVNQSLSPKGSGSENKTISLYLMAKEQKTFPGYLLYQALSQVGLSYGKMKIFHYMVNTSHEPKILFSVASALNPGILPMDNMHDFSTPGLVLFFTFQNPIQAEKAIERMIAVAEKLAEILEGFLLTQDKQPWSREAEEDYYHLCKEYVD